MDVSVIIPLFNGKNWIRDTLTSVISQTHPPSEIIVVDDESTDNSPDIISEEFPNVRLEENPDSGPYEARNHGARCATADKLAFLDQDDLWHEDHLKTVDRAFQELPECVAAFSKVTNFNDSESPDYSPDSGRPRTYDVWEGFPYNKLGEPVGGVVRREAFEQVDGWWSEVEGCGDYHLWLKLGTVGDVAITGRTTAGHRVHHQSLSRTLRRDQVETYFSRHVKASEEAMNRRIQRGLRTGHLKPMLDAHKALQEFLRAIMEEDRFAMQSSLEKFGALMADESQSKIYDVWCSFWFYASPYFDRCKNHAFVPADLVGFLRRWPDKFQRPRNFLHEWFIRRASSPTLVRRHPTEFQYWSLLVRRVIQRFRAQLT